MVDYFSNVNGAYLYTSLCMIALCINVRYKIHIYLSILIFIDSLISWSLHKPLLSIARNGTISVSAWYMFSALSEFAFVLLLSFAHYKKIINISARTLTLIFLSLFFITIQSLRLIDRLCDSHVLDSIYTPAILFTVLIKVMIISTPTFGLFLLKLTSLIKGENKTIKWIEKIAKIAMLDKQTVKRRE